MLLETGMAFIRSQPLSCLNPFLWMMQGKCVLKEKLALATQIDIALLPYNAAVLDLLKAEKLAGRQIILATATHHSVAQKIADHLDLFHGVLASDDKTNLSAHKKRDLLVQLYGKEGYDYVGNSSDDLIVWESARHAYIVEPEYGVEKRANKLQKTALTISTPRAPVKDWLKALRLHQWMKNLLIFVPLLAAHKIGDFSLLFKAIIAFVLFGICASSVYLLNDLLDLADDRHHKTKKNRPFAAGRLSLKSGILVFPALLILAFGGALLLMPLEFVGALFAYYILTLAYSLSLKRKMAVDVIALALLYTMRIIAGATALALTLTFWMLAFSMFMFLSLAMVKRYAELRDAHKKGHKEKTRGRGYYPDDLEMISSLGAAAGYLSIMVLALYIHDNVTVELYKHPQIIWMACPLLLFWMTRIWVLTHRGEMHDDPVVFAIKDRTSLVVGALFCLVFWIAA
jgi:4-hydroxybenzoate polyprenyltransferase